MVNVAKAYISRSIENKEFLNNNFEGKETKNTVSSSEIKSLVLECLQPLSIMERKIFLLRDIEGFSVKETAEIVGCSSIAVRVHLSSARKKIKKRLQEKFLPLTEFL